MGAVQRRASGGFVVVGGILCKVNAYEGSPVGCRVERGAWERETWRMARGCPRRQRARAALGAARVRGLNYLARQSFVAINRAEVGTGAEIGAFQVVGAE